MNLSNPVNLLIAGIYYTLAVIISFFSVFGVYIFIRYGKSQTFSLIASLVYIFIFITLLSTSYNLLQRILA